MVLPFCFEGFLYQDWMVRTAGDRDAAYYPLILKRFSHRILELL